MEGSSFMVLFFKKNWLIILAIVLLFYLCVDGFLIRKSLDDSNYESCIIGHQQCINGTNPYPQSCSYYEYCIQHRYDEDVTTVFQTILCLIGFPGIFGLDTFSPLLIIIITTYWFHQNLNSGNFKNELTRMSYKDFWKRNYKRILKIALILPCTLIFLYILSYFISSGFQMSEELISGESSLYSIEYVFRNKIPLYLITVLVNIFLNSIFYSNLALFTAQKSKNMLISIIYAYLLFLFTAFFFEVFLDYFLVTFFKNNIFSILTVFNFYAYDGVKSLSSMFLFALFLASASALINYKCYKNKEMVIIESEK